MLNQLVRHCRPLAVRTCRNLCTRRNVPVIQIRSPWRRARDFDDFLSAPFFRRNWVQEIERDMEDTFKNLMRNSELASFYNASRQTGTQVTFNSNVFEVRLDVKNFAPEELEVKLSDRKLFVVGKHEQKADDHGFVKREFQREFELPEDVNLDSLKSTMSEDGVLTIRANVKAADKQPDRVIEIKREGSPKDEGAS